MSKNIWGGIVNASEPAARGKVLRIQAGSSELARLLDHWKAMAEAERPALIGLSATPGSSGKGPTLELLLSQVKENTLAVLEVSPANSFPRPSAIWPYSLWWEEELSAFNEVNFSGVIPERHASWRPL
ncbi:MAG: hypothetical protein ACXWQO_08315 [Bdellovibrionota bacterium]